MQTLLPHLEATKSSGEVNCEVAGVTYDSRQLGPGDIFVAIAGLESDGNRFVAQAAAKGAAAIVSEKMHPDLSIPVIQVRDARVALARLALALYDYPDRTLTLIGTTGTNGKSTTAYLSRSILENAGYRTGLISTIEYVVGGQSRPAVRTTPEAPELAAALNQMVKCGQSHAVIEVTSHALALHRTHGLQFDCAVFTNFSHEHLDFHQTADAYLQAKTRLFESLDTEKVAILNADDPASAFVRERTEAHVLTFGVVSRDADLRGKLLAGREADSSKLRLAAGAGVRALIRFPNAEIEIASHLRGSFNLYNILAAAAVGWSRDLSPEVIKRGIEAVQSVPGRLQPVRVSASQPFQVLVDFAHTPEALRQALLACRAICRAKLCLVFGCGGERDKGKRSQMGHIAGELADRVILTTDNPRREDPLSILHQIDAGLPDKNKRKIVADRKLAIYEALMSARAGDLVLIAGKGHETYQEIDGERRPFDDGETAREILNELQNESVATAS